MAIELWAVDHSQRNKPSSLKTMMSAIKRRALEQLGAIWPTDAPAPFGRLFASQINDTIRGLRKMAKDKSKKQMRPVTTEHLQQMKILAGVQKIHNHEFHARMITSNRACLRHASAVKLIAADVTFKAPADDEFNFYTGNRLQQLTPRRLKMRIKIRAEKNNKLHEPRDVHFEYVGGNSCVVTELLAWVQRAKPKKRQRVFAKYTPTGRRTAWTYDDCLKQVKKRAATIGLTSKVGCHSLRRGGIADYIRAGVPLELIIKITGHRSLSFLEYFHNSEHVMVALTRKLVEYEQKRGQ